MRARRAFAGCEEVQTHSAPGVGNELEELCVGLRETLRVQTFCRQSEFSARSGRPFLPGAAADEHRAQPEEEFLQFVPKFSFNYRRY